MAKKLDIWKCEKCGNIVEVITGGSGFLICCGESMEPIVENTVDAAREKHVPVIEKTGSGWKVTVGSVLHPMDAPHYIMWIELIAGGVAYRTFLEPGAEPEAEFCIDASQVTARAYCNLHGLWSVDA
jgi:superoxide reductase